MQPPIDDDYDAHSIAVRQLIVGIFLIVVGVLVTAITYEAARGSDEYVLAFGPVIIGAIAAVRGFIGMLQR
jgi:uncharacterized membrane protein